MDRVFITYIMKSISVSECIDFISKTKNFFLMQRTFLYTYFLIDKSHFVWAYLNYALFSGLSIYSKSRTFYNNLKSELSCRPLFSPAYTRKSIECFCLSWFNIKFYSIASFKCFVNCSATFHGNMASPSVSRKRQWTPYRRLTHNICRVQNKPFLSWVGYIIF